MFITISLRFAHVFFFYHTPTTEIYTLSLHDALPICIIDITLSNCINSSLRRVFILTQYKALSLSRHVRAGWSPLRLRDRKSTRLNSSHLVISYAVFCLKKKKRRLLVRVAVVAHDDTC